MSIPLLWLDDRPGATPCFPPLAHARREPDGLLAAGGRLDPDWLLAAYRRGIFPWYSGDEPILWWSPDPRLILEPSALRIHRSLAQTLRRGDFEVRCDTAFADVMAACAAPRDRDGGTWITPAMRDAYVRMHELGHAHSVECWRDGELVGGLYGMEIGGVFFGESMFTRVRDASKVALAHLCRFVEARGVRMIDCQMTTPHLVSLGARECSRADFANALARLTVLPQPPGRWPARPFDASVAWKKTPSA